MFLTLLCCMMILFIWYLKNKWDESKERCLLPGPKPSMLVGNLLQLQPGRPHQTLSDWSTKYGPIFQVFFFNKRVVVANDYKSIMEVLVSKGSDFAGRPSSFRMSYQQQGTGFAFLDPSPKATALRKLTHKHLKVMGEGMARIENIALQIKDFLLDRFRESNGQPVDPKEDIYKATMSMMFLLILGEWFRDGDPEFQKLRDIEDAQNLGLNPGGEGELLDIMPFLRYLPNNTYNLLQKSVRIRREFWLEWLDRFERGDVSDLDGVAQSMIKSLQREEAKELGITERDVEVAVFNLQVAGVVSTTIILYCFLNIILHYPRSALRMREEIDRCLGKREVTLNDKKDLHYCRATVLELLRYTSSGPLSIPHKTLVDTDLCGYFIPKDTIVLTNLWKLHHDESFWDNPWDFQPERFIDEEGHLVRADHPNRKHLMPFSAGQRVCVGENLALSRLLIWMSSIVQRFELLPADGEDLVTCDPRHFDVGLGIQPLPYKIRFMQREAFKQ